MPIVVPVPIGYSNASLTSARQFVAREAGPFRNSIADATSNATTIVDLTAPIHSTNDQGGLFQDHYLYRPAAILPADKQRRVRIYTPAAGSLVPDLGYTNTPAGEAFELLGTLSPEVIERHINQALRELMVEVEFTISPILGQTRQQLPVAVAPWLQDTSWIRQVGYLGTSETRDQVDPFDYRYLRGEVYKDLGTLYLKHPGHSFDPANTTLYVKAISPAFYQCRATSADAFGTKVDGLTAEANEAPVDLEWLAAAALVVCWRRESQVLEPGANGLLVKDLLTAIQWKTEQTELHLVTPPLTFLPAVRAWGPRQAGRGAWF